MKDLNIVHYVDKKLMTTTIQCDSVKLEIKSKMIVLTDKQNVVFVCKIIDFVSLCY